MGLKEAVEREADIAVKKGGRRIGRCEIREACGWYYWSF